MKIFTSDTTSKTVATTANLVKDVIARKENCIVFAEDKITLYDFLNGLSPEQQRAALVHLSVKWAASQGGENA